MYSLWVILNEFSTSYITTAMPNNVLKIIEINDRKKKNLPNLNIMRQSNLKF